MPNFKSWNFKSLFYSFLMLSANGVPAGTRAEVEFELNESNFAGSHDYIKAYCQDASLITYNKGDITLGVTGLDGQGVNQLRPKACVTKSSITECRDETMVLAGFQPRPDYEDFKKARKETEANFESWNKTASATLDKLTKYLPNEIKSLYEKQFASVARLVKTHQFSQFSQSINGGQCSEIMYRTLNKILMEAQRRNEKPPKIQIVTVLTKGNNPPINDHTYLLIGSDCEDVYIKNSRNAVQEYLNKITTGKICDPWNKGYYADFVTDDSNFYNTKANWKSLRVVTINLDFFISNEAPASIKEFLCNELKKIGISLYPKSFCQSVWSYFQPKQTSAENTLPELKTEVHP